MLIEKTTKERFVKMLQNHEIVCIFRRLSQRSDTYEYKFIGMHEGLKWDFTWCIADATGCETNGKSGISIAVRSKSAQYLLETALKSFQADGIDCELKTINNICSFGM